MAPTASSAELLQAQAELWCHAMAYLRSMALQSVIKLGIPTAIHRCGGAASLSELHAHLPVPASKLPCLSRLMKLLVISGVFGESEAGAYSLTPVSRLLVEDDAAGGRRACLSPFAILATSPFHLRSSQRLPEWMEKEDAAAETPFMMAHGGAGFYGYAGRDLKLGALFNEAMGADGRVVAEVVVGECGELFAGIASLVDVGGGDGTMAKAAAKAFPHVRCKVLELPQVAGNMPVGGMVEFVAGDMMEFIPPADVVLLKQIILLLQFVLHNWSDEDCVRILKRAREAISTREPKGKVVIIDTVAGSVSSKQAFEAQVLMDICMMMLTTGEVRDEEKWRGLFVNAARVRWPVDPCDMRSPDLGGRAREGLGQGSAGSGVGGGGAASELES
ncbi:trans-resveratrol di-O-methyltransferase-like [Panicum miliaceum]|uniref:Trans-resveratrol di-O-methyltransferase-like n=1 Tax=Panicum miliaceum TaxID=4540 RepID=A0A3L6RVG9_PANMI|nr:trans-resveratrol di-O-methyltransferase-like [Panicum miliaceum]